jgi:hypothetical protein
MPILVRVHSHMILAINLHFCMRKFLWESNFDTHVSDTLFFIVIKRLIEVNMHYIYICWNRGKLKRISTFNQTLFVLYIRNCKAIIHTTVISYIVI